MATRLFALATLSMLFASVASHNFLISGDDGWATAQARAQYSSLVAAGFDVSLPKVVHEAEAHFSPFFHRSFYLVLLKCTMAKATELKRLQPSRAHACLIHAQQDLPRKALIPTIVKVTVVFSYPTTYFCICSSFELCERLRTGRS